MTMTMHRFLPTLLPFAILLATCSARRGAIVRDGMSSKQAYENPFAESDHINTDPDVVAITTRCPKWSLDPIECDDARTESDAAIVKEVLSEEMRRTPVHVTFRSKVLSGGKRSNWMRATAHLGDPAGPNKSSAVPLRAVWTCSNADADASMTYEETNPKTGRVVRREIGSDVLEEGYEDCLKRVYGKYVELELLLPKKGGATMGGPPPSLVYRVPIRSGHVNPMGMVSKGRATVTLYPRGRTLAAAASASTKGRDAKASAPRRDEAIPLGLSNVHLPLGPGLVDPSWAKGRKMFWKGRSLGLV